MCGMLLRKKTLLLMWRNRFSGLGARRSLVDSLIPAKILLLGLRAKKRDEASHNLGKDATIFKVCLCTVCVSLFGRTEQEHGPSSRVWDHWKSLSNRIRLLQRSRPSEQPLADHRVKKSLGFCVGRRCHLRRYVEKWFRYEIIAHDLPILTEK